MQNIKKILRIGTIKIGAQNANIFCKAAITEGKLSISGVIGPKSNGDALGGVGQIDMEFSHRNPAHNDKRYNHLTTPSEITFAPGWTENLWFDFLDIWKTWHLNDMLANCPHQTGPDWDPSREITIYHFRLRQQVNETLRAAKKRAQDCLAHGKTFTPFPEETRLANLADKITHHRPKLPAPLARDYEPNGPQYTNDHYNMASEVKKSGWTKETEHSLGILSKKCTVCGYAYGSEWRREELPETVYSFIASLPDTDKTPAWV